MATLKDLAGDQKPVIAYPKTIQFGPVTLDGYMLENGEFRQSIHSTEAALGAEGSKLVHRMLVPRYPLSVPALTGQTQDSLQRKGSQGNTPRKGHTKKSSDSNGSEQIDDPVVMPVVCPGVPGFAGVAYTINLPMVVEAWKQVAISDSKYAKAALELLGLSAIHSIERTYQEAFGVSDARKTNDRLLEWAIRLDAGKHFPLFGGEFHKHFARVTGVAIGHRYAQVCLAELVYHRLPEPIYETLKDINPLDENGWRQFSHSQLMTDDMRQRMREIVAAVTSQLANTASKAEDPKAYKKCLHRLDKTLRRYTTRGGNIDNFTKNNEVQNDDNN